MTEKVKKMPFLNLKRWQGRSDPTVPSPSGSAPSTPTRTPTSEGQQFVYRTQQTPPVVRSRNSESKPRRGSAGGIKELVQCPLCLEVLHNPRMLPCQHTFCMACLIVYVADATSISCPICKVQVHVPSNTFVSQLPSNLYIDSLLELVGKTEELKPPPIPPVPQRQDSQRQSVELFAGGVRCSQCQSVCDNSDVTPCQHCKQKFCRVCWSQHLDEMQTQIGSILKQLDSASSRLEHKIENYKDRVEHLTKQINLAAEEKINAIIESKEDLLKEAEELNKAGDQSSLALKTSLTDARNIAANAMGKNLDAKENDKVITFINLHQNALQLLSDVSKWDAETFVFDKDNFCIELDASTALEAESDDPLPEGAKQNDPLESEDSLVLHYRSRNFVPHYVWRKTSRPSGVGVSPWSNHLYICSVDTHSVLVVERSQAKIVARLTSEEMLCPAQIAFMKSLGEIYVTDKWKHCIHVFNKDGEYRRSIGQKGSRTGMFRSPEGIATDNAQLYIYVADTGNDRVQVLQTDGKFIDHFGVSTKLQSQEVSTVWQRKETNCTELNGPTSVAITNERVVVLDSGNRRVKVYNKFDKTKLFEFGSLGQRKGQFRQPEVLTVDPMGFILVGDSGNSRVQVFKPNGQLVRAFGGLGTEPGRYGWISGIHVTKQLDVIISDTKNHSVNFL